MIISASRRTDIPAFYAKWFMNRICAGYCIVPNPFNHKQISYISLHPQDVDVIVFWTRNPRPLFRALDELDASGYHYYFQFTIMDNPRLIDPKSPPVDAAIKTFKELADRVGADRVIWRYDPIVISTVTDAYFHQNCYTRIAEQLRGYTMRSVVSVMDVYKKAEKRLRSLTEQGVRIPDQSADQLPNFAELMHGLAETARQNKMEIVSCAEELNLTKYDIKPGKCVDDEYIARIFNLPIKPKKDPSQRTACGCVISRDIGMYDSCLFGCQYCYATSSFERAATNHAAHDPRSPSLLGHYEATPATAKDVAHQIDEDDSCSPTQLRLLP